MEAMIESEQDAERKRALKWALDVGHQKVRLEQAGKEVPAELAAEHEKADAQVLSKLREQLGLDEVRGRVRRRRADAAGGARVLPRDRRPGRGAVGPVRELRLRRASTCPARSSSAPSARSRPGMELKLAEDGEVLMRGPQIMKGYRNMPDQTAEAIDADGWLHTGDIGELDDEGYLKIVDRKKELIITAGGKNISPANLEAKLKAHPLIGTACVIGDRRPYLTALIVLDPDVAPAWAAQQGIDGRVAARRWPRDERVRAEIQQGGRRRQQRRSRTSRG